MFNAMRFSGTAFVLAAVVLLATAQPSFAQRGGHGGGGGGMGGHSGMGGHPGMGHPGMGHPGMGHPGGFRPGYGYGGWGYGGFYGGLYLDAPYYYGGYPYYNDAYPYAYPGPVPYYPQAPVGPGAGYQPYQLPMPKTDLPAIIQIRVPADAELWFDSHKTSQQGGERLFTTPPLAVGRSYSYEIRATWMANGMPVNQTRLVQVEAGKQVVLDLSAAPADSGK
jgi:uncharacterized protein (TIGR03000 family)